MLVVKSFNTALGKIEKTVREGLQKYSESGASKMKTNYLKSSFDWILNKNNGFFYESAQLDEADKELCVVF